MSNNNKKTVTTFQLQNEINHSDSFLLSSLVFTFKKWQSICDFLDDKKNNEKNTAREIIESATGHKNGHENKHDLYKDLNTLANQIKSMNFFFSIAWYVWVCAAD